MVELGDKMVAGGWTTTCVTEIVSGVNGPGAVVPMIAVMGLRQEQGPSLNMFSMVARIAQDHHLMYGAAAAKFAPTKVLL